MAAPTRVRTPAEALEAGRQHAIERGDRLTSEQAVRLAALLRPHVAKLRAPANGQRTA